MSLVIAVKNAMERIAPLRLAEKWDNVGLLLEAPSPPEGGQILLTTDLTPQVLSEALTSPTPTSLILSYHAPIFHPVSSLTLSVPLQASLLQCARRGISIYTPHTALDCTNGGINDWLAGLITSDKENVTVLGEPKEDGAGLGRVVTLKQKMSIADLCGRIKSGLGLSQIQLAPPFNHDYSSASKKLISTVAICAGAGGSVLKDHDAEVYFTGEMFHHDVLAAIANGKYVILCGHTNTERGYLPTLRERLIAELQKEPGGPFTVNVSQVDRHPLFII